MIILGSSIAAALAILWVLAAVYGTRVARWRLDHRYARAELRSRERACDLADLRYARQRELREAQDEQARRHDDRRRELHKWDRQYYTLLTETSKETRK